MYFVNVKFLYLLPDFVFVTEDQNFDTFQRPVLQVRSISRGNDLSPSFLRTLRQKLSRVSFSICQIFLLRLLSRKLSQSSPARKPGTVFKCIS